MALSEIELKRCEKDLATFMEKRRPPPHIREQVDLSYRIDGHSVEIFEIRPKYQEPTQKHESSIAKATFVRTRGRWRVFGLRQDLRWHSYEPKAKVNTFKEFLDVVDRYEHFCFWG